jgi:hypothetical protein
MTEWLGSPATGWVLVLIVVSAGLHLIRRSAGPRRPRPSAGARPPARRPRLDPNRRRAVYEIDTEERDAIFYIGSSFDPEDRMGSHASRSWWFPFAPARFQATLRPDRITWYETAAKANAVETAMIKRHQPWANTRGTRHGKNRRRVRR